MGDTSQVLSMMKTHLSIRGIEQVNLPLSKNQFSHSSVPSVCVLIPINNQANYLYRAVTSAVWQLQTPDEIIVIDDGSTDIHDSSGLRPFLCRVLWLFNRDVKGVSYSRNRGIKASRAEWIKLLDADDVLAACPPRQACNRGPRIKPHGREHFRDLKTRAAVNSSHAF